LTTNDGPLIVKLWKTNGIFRWSEWELERFSALSTHGHAEFIPAGQAANLDGRRVIACL
jgi:hypothetical protein